MAAVQRNDNRWPTAETTPPVIISLLLFPVVLHLSSRNLTFLKLVATKLMVFYEIH